jgi:hypothetical protein
MTQTFKGHKFKAHLEIDHVTDSMTVLDQTVMAALAERMSNTYNCKVAVFKSDRGGNRAHVFIDHKVYEHEMYPILKSCTTWLEELIKIETIDDHMILDESTVKTRVIRAPSAKSGKPYRHDKYKPWLGAMPGKGAQLACDMGVTMRAWAAIATMTNDTHK